MAELVKVSQKAQKRSIVNWFLSCAVGGNYEFMHGMGFMYSMVPVVKELYIGDTLAKEEQYEKMFSMGGGGIYNLDKELVQMMRDTLLAEEPLEVSIVFEYMPKAGGEYIQTPRLSFPVVLQ